jgi:peptide deformylase
VVYEIVTFGQDILRRKAQPVGAVNADLRALAQSMLETMHAARGVGLAAEQVGRDEAVCVIDVPPNTEKPDCVAENAAIAMPLTLINPEILKVEGTQRNDEGCLSFPDISAPITRANRVTFAYTDLDGQRLTATASGLLARAVQHELDHLNGVLLVDRMSTLQRMAVAGQLRRLQQQAKQA